MDENGKVKFEIISGYEEAGEGSAIIINDKGGNICLDCGFPPENALWAYYKKEQIVKKIVKNNPKFLVISHYHHDHCGALGYVLIGLKKTTGKWPIIICTPLTETLIRGHLAKKYRDIIKSWNFLRFARWADGIRLIPNYHSVPGSAAVQIKKNGKTILYSGDCWAIPGKTTNPIDLLIIDSTNALKEKKREDNKEIKVRAELKKIINEGVSKKKKVIISLFSTQLERAEWLFNESKAITGYSPKINGSSLFHNMRNYYRFNCKDFWLDLDDPVEVALVTGVWAQGLADEQASVLVRLAHKDYSYYQINPGDIVVLSARVPTWDNKLMEDIRAMCLSLKNLGARIIVDTSAPQEWGSFAELREVHEGGHGNLPEIVDIINQVNPAITLPFHGNKEAKEKVVEYCRNNNKKVISELKYNHLTI